MENNKRKKKRKGAILPLAIIMVIILFIIGLALIRLGLNARLQSVRTTAMLSARAAADAGMTEATDYLFNLYSNQPGWSDVVDLTVGPVNMDSSFGNASFTYSITGPNPISGYDITSTGTAAKVTRIVHALMILKSDWFGVGVKDTITMHVGGTIILIPEDADFRLQTNSTEDGAVDLKMGIYIPGAVVIGPTGEIEEVIDTKRLTDWEDEPYASEREMEFDPKPAPNDPPPCRKGHGR